MPELVRVLAMPQAWKTLYLNIPAELHEQLSRLAKADQRSLAKFVAITLEKACNSPAPSPTPLFSSPSALPSYSPGSPSWSSPAPVSTVATGQPGMRTGRGAGTRGGTGGRA